MRQAKCNKLNMRLKAASTDKAKTKESNLHEQKKADTTFESKLIVK